MKYNKKVALSTDIGETKNPGKLKRTATLAALGAQVIFGFSFMFTKIALDYASPMTVIADRYLVALLGMTLVMAVKKEKIKFKDITDIIEKTMGKCTFVPQPTIEDIYNTIHPLHPYFSHEICQQILQDSSKSTKAIMPHTYSQADCVLN